MKTYATALALWALTSTLAQAATKPELAGVDFLVGRWEDGAGTVVDTGGTSKGTSIITVEADGAALLRRDHTQTFDKSGKLTGGFSQLMVIYPESGTLHAEYTDGEGHVIHYVSATVNPGKSVTFNSAPGAGPIFHLTYTLLARDALMINFGMTPPGATAFHPIATGTLKRSSD
jgi:hypothetical protein